MVVDIFEFYILNLATVKVCSRCDWAKTLVKNMANCVCLIESESGRNTTAKSPTFALQVWLAT
ncbi:hypothetical protein CHUAL_008043 [Chamberlinius hualienensis]